MWSIFASAFREVHALKDAKVHKDVRAISSVGSEHLVYTEGVGGSNPSLPTDFLKASSWRPFLISRVISSAGSEHYLDKVGVTGSNPVSPTN